MNRSGPAYSDAAIVIGLRDLGEADRLVFLFARNAGRFNAVARAARRPRSRLAGHLQLFATVEIELVKTRSLDVITAARSVAAWPQLSGAGQRFAAAARVVEILRMGTAANDPDPGLFALAAKALALIAQRERIGPQLWQFELLALARLGLGLELGDCADCNRHLDPDRLWFGPQSGGALCPQCATTVLAVPMSLAALKALRYMANAQIGDGDRLLLDANFERELAGLLDQVLTANLGRQLRSSGMAPIISGN